MKHLAPKPYKGVEDYLRDLCKIYRGEEDNPHDVNSLMDEERMIQFLKYHLWDAERSVLENPGEWRLYILGQYGSLPTDSEAVAKKLYQCAVKAKLEKLKEIGINLFPIYERLNKTVG